ncbi:MAG: hypothetical protein MSA61_02380 [Coriobacteriaceae bacterium]|uniref:hypothetical protein n=1 Tax=Tractidigestivibacter sp. TaxID=2847320 RepID=UPI002A823290|nr:hypothetical protein [Tractidigestivibacter sp.]MCI7438057.1 hypothetical protein [Coriobacteriaceae bacterium]MDY4535136.1 hypothetical protein [Tractidigestivibacter sp.]
MIRYQQQVKGEWIAVGLDGKGRLLELVYLYDETNDLFFVFHGMTPPSGKRFVSLDWRDGHMDVREFMKAHGLTDAALDEIAAPYERGDYPQEEGKVYSGSHLDAVGKRRITVVYDARDTQRVAALAKERGVRPSVIYRDALDYYLESQG